MNNRETVLRFLAEPSDVNFGGKVHGGAVMKWIDHAGYTCASAWSGCYCVTAHVGSVSFVRPVHIGNLVEARARIVHTGRTSMHITVDVSAGDPRYGTMEKTTHCVMIFVAVDENGRPVPVRKYEPETEDERRMESYAIRLSELRDRVEKEKAPFLS